MCHTGAVGGQGARDQVDRDGGHAKPAPVRIRGWTLSVKRPDDRGQDDRHHRHRREQQRRLQRGVPADQLGVEHDREAHRRRRERHRGDREVRDREVAVVEEAERDQRLVAVDRAANQTKIAKIAEPADDRGHHPGVPVVLVALLDPEDQQEHPDAAERDAEPVEAGGCGSRSLGTSRTASTNPTTPTGMLMKKIHSQPNAVDQDPAQDRADQRGDTGGRAPQRHRLAALLGGEDARDHGHRLRSQQRGPEPWNTRAAISISMLVVRPHHREARVKRVRPIR